MIKLGISEYIRNCWYNLCIIFIIIVMMIVSTTLISNIDEQTKVYRLAEKYVDNDSLFLNMIDATVLEQMNDYGDILIAKTIQGHVNDDEYSGIFANVYTSQVMSYMKPMLDSGVQPDAVSNGKETISVLLSHNPYGLEAGDTFLFRMYAEPSDIVIKVRVAGIISEGQRLHTRIKYMFSSATYKDFFPVYSYEQTEEVIMIIPESELGKIPEVNNAMMYNSFIIDLDDDLSLEKKIEAENILQQYNEKELHGMGNAAYPKPTELIERSNIMYNSTILKYVPIVIIVVLLFCICIVAIVTVKNIKSLRYYVIMYTHGMYYGTVVLMAGVEMVFNCVMAFIGTVALIKIQNTFNIGGEINCHLNDVELYLMEAICVVIIVSSLLTTRSVLKERTPVEILKSTVQ